MKTFNSLGKSVSPVKKTETYAAVLVLMLVAMSLVLLVSVNRQITEQNRIAEEVLVNPTTSSTAITSEPSPVSPINLAEWLNEWRRNPSYESLEQGLQIAQQRQARMAEWIENDPGRAIDHMLSYQDYLDLPREISQVIETPIATVEDLNVVIGCGAHVENKTDDIEYFAEWAGSVRKVNLPEERNGLSSKSNFPMVGIELDNKMALHREVAQLLPREEIEAAAKLFGLASSRAASSSSYLVGNKILDLAEIKGTQSIEEVLAYAEKQIGPDTVQAALSAIESGNDAPESVYETVKQSSESWTLGPKKVLLIRLAFSDLERRVRSQGEFQEWLQIVSDQFEQMSYGQTSFSVMDVTEEVYTLPHISQVYLNLKSWFGKLHTDAVNLATADGVDTESYDIVIAVTPHFGTSVRGLATVGKGKQWFRDEPYGFGYSTMRHECGHNYGLHHAGAWDSKDGSVMPADDSSEFHVEYGDVFDHMGSSGLGDEGDFNAFEKFRLNWIGDSHVLTLNENSEATIRISHFDHPQAYECPTLALRIPFREREALWVMYKAGTPKQDSSGVGAYIIWQYQSDRARLLDMTPESQRFLLDMPDAFLLPGNSFTDPSESIHLTTLAEGSTGEEKWLDIQVQVEMNAPPNEPPVVKLELLTKEVRIGEPVTFFARSYDPEKDPLVYRWIFGDGALSESQRQRIEHVFQEPGTYTIQVTADDLSGGIDRDRVSVEVAAGDNSTNFVDWITAEVTEVDDLDQLLPESDYDRDGFSNLLEYGLGLNPEQSDSRDFLTTQLLSLARGDTFEIAIRGNDADLALSFHVSHDLKNWIESTIHYHEIENRWTTETEAIQVVGAENQNDGFWKLTIRIVDYQQPLFMKFGASYQSDYEEN